MKILENWRLNVAMNHSPAWELETAPGAIFNWECDQKSSIPHKNYSTNSSEITNINDNIIKENLIDGEERLCYVHTTVQQDEIYNDIHDPAEAESPLSIRPLPPNCHTICTWNLNNGFSTKAIIDIMLKHNIFLMFLQEPMVMTGPKRFVHQLN